MGKIAVIIINWNTKELLRQCLKAVCGPSPCAQGLGGYNVIVVDNGSTDGSTDMIRNNFAEVQLIANSENLGFGTANNQAIKIADGEYLLFLNTDSIIDRSSIERLIEFMNSHPKAGLCTPTLVRADGSIQDTFGPYPTLATEFLGRWLLRLFFPNRFTPYTLKDKKPRKVNSIRGACMLARRTALEDVGGFDEGYFLFLEETDLCLRLHKKGYSIWWLPGVKVYHKGGGSADTKGVNARIEYWKSRYLFFRKHYPIWKRSVLRSGLLLKLFIDWTLNLFGKKLKRYSTIILWHILGCPGDWGLSTGNTVKTGDVLVRRGFESWWRENKNGILGAKSIIKDSATRSLIDYKGEAYVKRYKTKPRTFLKVRGLLKEWRLISRLRQLGIPTITPLAVGNGYLVTQKLQDVENLHNFILHKIQKLTLQEKINLTRSLAEFVNKLHRKGLYHGDLHPGNILIAKNGSKFYITDLHRARLKIGLSKRKILRNLVQLNVFFSLHTSRHSRLRFLKCYSENYKHYARKIEIRTKRACQRLWHKRDRLYLKKKKYGVRGIYDGMSYVVNPKYVHLDLAKILPNLRSGRGIPIKDSRSSYLSGLELPGLGKVVLKIHRQKKFINYIKDIWRNSRAFRAWCSSWALLMRQISTPEPILAIEKRRFGILKESLIITRNIDPAENVTVWLRKNWKDRPFMLKKYFIDKLANYIKTIHNHGISPCDLKGSNILVQEGFPLPHGERTSWVRGLKFYLIDLDHLKRKTTVPLNKRLRNMVQLYRSCPVSASMRWRFVKSYFPKKDIDERKRIARKIYRKVVS